RSVVEKARAWPSLIGRDLVKEVTCSEPYDWDEGTWELGTGYRSTSTDRRQTADDRQRMKSRPFVLAYDFGIKRNILRNLVAAGCRVHVVPAATSAAEALGLKPDGIFLSNGPGDPDVGPYADIVRGLVGRT